jgi:WD40 repeat protein
MRPQIRRNFGLEGHTRAVTAVAFSADGALLASGSDDRTVRLWDTATGRPHGSPLTGHVNRVKGVAFSPTGNLLASAGADGTVRLWNPATGQPDGDPLEGYTDVVNAVAFSSDGTLATAGGDGAVLLWNTATHQLRLPPLEGHSGAVWTVAFNREGSLLVSSGTDQAVQLWDLRWWDGPPSDWAAIGCSVVNRNLTAAEWKQFVVGLPYQLTCAALPPGKGEPDDSPVAAYSSSRGPAATAVR